MKRKQWFTLGVAVFATLLFFSLTRADQPQSKIAPCIANWDNLTWEERTECTEPWGGIYLAEGTVTALKQQTVDALPTQSRDSIRATQQAMWVEGGRPTLVPPTLTPVPVVIPEGWEVVEPYRNPYQGEGQDLHWLKSTINAWWLGAIIADDGYPRRIIVKSSSRMCGLGIRHIKLNGLPAKGEGYGIFCAPTSIEGYLAQQYRVEVIGHTQDLTERFYAISPERKIRNELALELVNKAGGIISQSRVAE